jgi:tetratricopeptide (TPR) repeat protein
VMRFFHNFQPLKTHILYLAFILLFLVFFTSLTFAQKNGHLLRTARALEKNHQYEDALILYKKEYHKNKRNMTAIAGIKNCYIGLQQYEALIGFLENVIRMQPTSSSWHVDLAEVYFINNDRDGALLLWRSYIEQNKTNPTAYRLVAMAMIRQRLFDEAIAIYLEAIQKIKGQDNLHVDIANIYKAQLNYVKASEHYLSFYLHRPKQLAYVRQQLLTLSDKGKDITPVVSAIDQFLKKHTEQSQVWEILAGLYLKNKNFNQAFEIYKNLESKTSNGAYIYKYALEALTNHAFLSAIQGYKYLIQTYPLSPLLPQAHHDLGRSYASQAYALEQEENSGQMMKQAVEIFEGILKADKKSGFVHKSMINLGDIYFDYYFDLDNAIKYYHNFLKDFSNLKTREKVVIRLGDAYLTKGQIDQALKIYQLVKSAEYKNLSRFKIAEIHYYTGNFKQTEQLLSNLISQTKPNHPLMNDILSRQMLLKSFSKDSVSLVKYAQADLLKFQKKYAEAAEEYSELSRGKNSLRSLAGRDASILLLKMEKYEESKDVLEPLLTDITEDKNHDELIFLLAKSEENLNHLHPALDLYNELLIKYPNSLFIQEARKKARSLNFKLSQERI